MVDGCATGTGGGTGEAGIMGCCRGEAGVWPHHGICICSPLGHLPCRFLFLIYLIRNWTMTVSRKPRNMPRSKLDPSIWALQLKFLSHVLLMDSLCLMMSPKTELSKAPWMSRGQMSGTAEFC